VQRTEETCVQDISISPWHVYAAPLP